MTSTSVTAEQLVAPIAAPNGGFAMVALDQRESLRRMFPPVGEGEVADDVLREFKSSAIAELSPLASGILLDRPLAVTTDRPAGIAEGCGLILAADVLEQPPGSPVVDTALDRLITPEFIAHVGAVAIKFLVIWRPDGSEGHRETLVREFVQLAADAGVASLVEGIVRPAEGAEFADAAERHRAILEAAAELSSYGGTIYKAEVPGYTPGDLSRVREQSERMSEVVDVPWVVLSNGTRQEDFAGGLREACLGGAHGFLAGRAVWSDTVAEADPAAAIRERSTQRLRELAAIVAETVGS